MNLLDWLDRQLPNYLADLAAWTAIDSGSHNAAGVNLMGDLVDLDWELMIKLED